MSAWPKRCHNSNCGKLFVVEQFSSAFGLAREIGVFQCPYYAMQTRADPRKAFRTHAVSWCDADWINP